jgi:hypothetical protein
MDLAVSYLRGRRNSTSARCDVSLINLDFGQRLVLLPQPGKAGWIQRGVSHGILDLFVSQIVLNEPQSQPLFAKK